MNQNQVTDIPEKDLRKPNGREVIARTSKSAYYMPAIKAIGFAVVTIALTAWLFDVTRSFWVIAAGLVILIVRGLLFVNTVLYLRSRVLFVDEEGVWMKTGYVEWNRGVHGLWWREYGDAVYFNRGLWDWKLNTGALHVRHRYKKGAKAIAFTEIDRPAGAAEAIEAAFRKFGRNAG